MHILLRNMDVNVRSQSVAFGISLFFFLSIICLPNLVTWNVLIKINIGYKKVLIKSKIHATYL